MCDARVMHVLCTCYACDMHVICMCCACAVLVLCMCYACVMHALCVCYVCDMHVIWMCYGCVMHVLCMWYACVMHVLCMCYASVIAVAMWATSMWDKQKHMSSIWQCGPHHCDISTSTCHRCANVSHIDVGQAEASVIYMSMWATSMSHQYKSIASICQCEPHCIQCYKLEYRCEPHCNRLQLYSLLNRCDMTTYNPWNSAPRLSSQQVQRLAHWTCK